ncbi:hypothetical protein O181_078608 [Austropuccinia psidii MF-1]|uniref:Uncharacterized protein n=1 Tax=Austropuccinia psidii MF-1 TaxID=1389203 RepID=A0A9Q3FF40_9BASI|nr:hypothetical protein [Austropuccinia psidii MF-1]
MNRLSSSSRPRSINGMNYHNFYFAIEDSPTRLQQMGHYWSDLCSQLGGANAAQRMNNLVCMEALGKLKMQKMNGGTEVPTMLKVPYASHANHYACTSSQQFKKTPMAVQAPNNSHTNPYACEGSQHFNSFLTPVPASDNSHANPYAFEGFQQC